MLIGYNKDGEIKFIFTDEKYLNNHFPNNTAKISNFWNIKDHGLKELFIPIAAWNGFTDHKKYKIVNNKLTLKNKEEIKKSSTPVIRKQGLFLQLNQNNIIPKLKDNFINKISKEKV
jgi:hypothetical protein